MGHPDRPADESPVRAEENGKRPGVAVSAWGRGAPVTGEPRARRPLSCRRSLQHSLDLGRPLLVGDPVDGGPSGRDELWLVHLDELHAVVLLHGRAQRVGLLRLLAASPCRGALDGVLDDLPVGRRQALVKLLVHDPVEVGREVLGHHHKFLDFVQLGFENLQDRVLLAVHDAGLEGGEHLGPGYGGRQGADLLPDLDPRLDLGHAQFQAFQLRGSRDGLAGREQPGATPRKADDTHVTVLDHFLVELLAKLAMVRLVHSFVAGKTKGPW